MLEPLDITNAKDRIIRRGMDGKGCWRDNVFAYTALDRRTPDAAYFNRLPLAPAA